jgi:Beta/Gamma crystallin
LSNTVLPRPHVILFEHRNFHGRHKHIFQNEPNLNATDDNSFNKITSSAVVLQGTWEFFREPNFKDGTGLQLGPGLYASIAEMEIQEKAVTSLRQVILPP